MSDQSNCGDVKQSRLAQEFIRSFVIKKDDLTSQIEGLVSCNNLQDQLANTSKDIQKLTKSLHDAVAFLPSYSVKKRQEEVRALEKLLKEKEELLVPKKKFGFKSKFKLNPKIESVISLDKSEKEEIGIGDNEHPVKTNSSLATAKSDSNFVTFENIIATSIVCEEKTLQGADVLLRNIQDSVIEVPGTPSTLRISGLKGCQLACGPVYTSVFVENCTDCKFYLCCQQLRTHSSKNLDIYLNVRSRAIIEDCTSIRFAPYTYNHPKINEWHNQVGIDQSSQRFDCVDDFNWLSHTASPNWSIIPEEERCEFNQTNIE